MNPAPFELTQLGLDRENFHRAGAKNYRGPCPRCGGERRFVLFTDKPFPKWNFYCEACGIKGFADQLNTALRQETTPEQRREWAERKQAEQAAAAKQRQAKLAEFSTAEIWQELASRMTAEHRATWETWGVPAEWQTHLRLGYQADRTYRGDDDELHHSAAFVIPYYHTGFEFQTVQYRLFNPPTPTDRYRFQQGLGTSYYQAEPAIPIGERVIICEGAKKAMAVQIHGHQPDTTVLAVPSKGDSAGVTAAVQDCARVYVMLDPDAGWQARKLARAVGPAARVVDLPVKADDALTQYEMTGRDLSAYLRQAN